MGEREGVFQKLDWGEHEFGVVWIEEFGSTDLRLGGWRLERYK